MKIKKPEKKPIKVQKIQGKAQVLPCVEASNIVRIWHSQSIKQSHNYQSSDASYGVEFHVQNTPEAIDAGIVLAEDLVETFLTAKYQEHRTLLEKISE